MQRGKNTVKLTPMQKYSLPEGILGELENILALMKSQFNEPVSQIPDVFVWIMKNGAKVAYVRFSVADILFASKEVTEVKTDPRSGDKKERKKRVYWPEAAGDYFGRTLTLDLQEPKAAGSKVLSSLFALNCLP